MDTKNLLFLVSILLFVAIFPGLPYSYYQILRFVVSIAAFFVSYKYYQSKLTIWSVIFLFTGILFNPIMPIYLNRSSWIPLDFVSACLFVLAALSSSKRSK